MQNISDVIDATNQLSASEMKEVCGEEEQLILSSGQVLSSGDLGQIAKAVSMYASYGDSYIDNGSGINVDLVPNGIMKYPPSYQYGMRVRFKPSSSKSAGTLNIKIASLPYRKLSDRPLDPGEGTPEISRILSQYRYYTAIYITNGTVDYWLLDNAVNVNDIGSNVVTTSAIANSAVTTDKLADSSITPQKIFSQAVDNSKLYNDIQLNKISGGTLSIGDLQMDANALRYGTVGEPNFGIQREGIVFSGVGSPGNLNPAFRVATYNMTSSFASSSIADATTRTASGHAHRIGQQYVFSPNYNTGIPNGSLLIFATISYIETTTGRRVAGAPAIVTSVNGSSTIEILSVSLSHVKDAAVDYPIDTSQSVIVSIFFGGDSL